MSQEGIPPDTAERMERWRLEREYDPCTIVEDPAVAETVLFQEIRQMIAQGEGTRLLKGREC
ncbi:MAG: hypothetical protein PHS73_02220 [Candidatus Peribacteraceae bacterium]|nr:hypothetical protein [Candidatus Peribacteraceae bacterium]